MPITHTDDSELLQLVANYKAAVLATQAADAELAKYADGIIEWEAALEVSIAKHDALSSIQNQLCAAFVWALEHSE